MTALLLLIIDYYGCAGVWLDVGVSSTCTIYTVSVYTRVTYNPLHDDYCLLKQNGMMLHYSDDDGGVSNEWRMAHNTHDGVLSCFDNEGSYYIVDTPNICCVSGADHSVRWRIDIQATAVGAISKRTCTCTTLIDILPVSREG